MVADAPVKPEVRAHPFTSVIEVRVYVVLIRGLGVTLNGVPLTTLLYVVLFMISVNGPVPEEEVNVSGPGLPEHIVLPVSDPWGVGFTVMASVLAVLEPHKLLAVTDSVPEVAVAEKFIVIEFVDPFIVAPVPL
jgi:hypothetical protein